MGLFGISRELQFRVCNHGKLHASPHTAMEGKHTSGGKGNLQGPQETSRQRVHGFLLAESLAGEQSHSSSFWALLSSQSMRALSFCHPTLFNLGFYLLIFYKVITH